MKVTGINNVALCHLNFELCIWTLHVIAEHPFLFEYLYKYTYPNIRSLALIVDTVESNS